MTEALELLIDRQLGPHVIQVIWLVASEQWEWMAVSVCVWASPALLAWLSAALHSFSNLVQPH